MPKRKIRKYFCPIKHEGIERKKESSYKEVIKYDEIKEIFSKAWEDDFNFTFCDESGKKKEGIFCVFIESNNSHIECTP